MASAKEIKTRIKSVSNTKKITKAMEMVAAAKMRKAIEAVLATREYANLTWNTVINISRNAKSENDSHPLLLTRKEIKNVLFVLVSSNRGLCGGFNSNVINEVNSYAKKNFNNGENIDVLSLGKKGISIRSRYGFNVVSQFDKPDTAPQVEDVRPIAKIVTDDYLAGKYDKVILVYTDFISGTVQEARAKQILPVDVKAEEDHLGKVEGKENENNGTKILESVFTFEPSVEGVLDEMIPRLLEVQLYQALLESNSSEHSARMMAMHQATDAATDMIAELTLSYNKARQASITNEISEIVAGANALS
jgi:F-type H+-transporting ATPase subunit gamma